jgi:small-conductance mechanosensitive channel
LDRLGVPIGSSDRATAVAVLALGFIYIYLIFVLEQFPATEPMGERLSGFLFSLAERFVQGLLDALPGVITVVVIFMLTRALLSLIDNIFRAAGSGRISLPGIHPDTTDATRRVIAVIVWAVAITFAYPYFPGSQSDVFKGLSVLLGLMLSLGSAGIVNQLMSGLVVTYSRALRKGDLVTVGGTTGVVIGVNSLSVKLTNLRHEEVTIPNALVVSSIVRNYSSLANQHGALLSTSVTIGYDTPWRQVHAMLILAAKRTSHILDEPAAFVLQRALSDFYVEYELYAAIDSPLLRPVVLSELHGHVLDVFNEYDVQIMSPHFMAQPASNIVVPPEHWYSTPSSKPADSGGQGVASNDSRRES